LPQIAATERGRSGLHVHASSSSRQIAASVLRKSSGSVYSTGVHFERCLRLPHPLHHLLLHRIRVSLLPAALLAVGVGVRRHAAASGVGVGGGGEVAGGGGGGGEAGGVRYMPGGGGRGRGGEDDCVLQTRVPRGVH